MSYGNVLSSLAGDASAAPGWAHVLVWPVLAVVALVVKR